MYFFPTFSCSKYLPQVATQSGKLVDGELHLESDNVDDLYRLALCARMRIGHVDDTIYGACRLQNGRFKLKNE